MPAPLTIPRRIFATGILVVLVFVMWSACGGGRAEGNKEDDRSPVITVCDRWEGRGGSVEAITSADGDVFYLIPSQAEGPALEVGRVYQIRIEKYPSGNTIVTQHTPLRKKAQPCP